MILRLVKCMAAGALVAAAMAVDVLTAAHKALAARAAAGHESTAAVVATGSIVTAVALGAVLFAVVSAAVWARSAWRARRAARDPQAALMPGTGGEDGRP